MAIEITDSNFSETVENTGKPVLMDFWAPWCGPCRMLTPIIEELSLDYATSDIIIGKVNVDENPVISTKFKIRSIPTLMFLKDNGELSEVVVGIKSKSEIVKKIDTLLKKDVA